MAKKNLNSVKKKFTGAYAKKKGNREELKIIKEHNELFKTDTLVSSRSESKRTDDAGVDVVDPKNIVPYYIQVKCTQNIPSVDLIKECKLKDKPLVIFWNKQIKKEKKCVSGGEFVILEKDLFYKILGSAE